MQITDENPSRSLKLVKNKKVQSTESLSFEFDTDDYSIDQIFLDAESYEDPIEENVSKIDCANWEEYNSRKEDILGRINYYLGELKDHLL